jgi:hypothetical protein
MAIASTSTRAQITIPAQKLTISKLTRVGNVVTVVTTGDPTAKLRLGDVVIFDSVGTHTEFNAVGALNPIKGVVTAMSATNPTNTVVLKVTDYRGVDFAQVTDTGTIYAQRVIVLPNGRSYTTGLNDITGVTMDEPYFAKIDSKYLSNGTFTDTTA